MARTQVRGRKIVGEHAQTAHVGFEAPENDLVQAQSPNTVDKIELEAVADGNPKLNDTETIIEPDGDSDVNRDPWCSGCLNGGRLLDCSFCPSRSACDVCVPFPDSPTLEASDFMCPICHLERREKEPYFAFWLKDAPATDNPTEISFLETRGWFSHAKSTPFAILSLRLATMSDNGFPPRAVTHHIRTYYSDDQNRHRAFEFFDFPFAFTTKAAINEFKSSMVALSRHLKQHGFKRILVFLATHSDPERGDLHFCEGFACTADELFDCLFPPTLRKYLQMQDSLFVLLACGAAVTYKPSLDSILGLATSGTFRATIGFAASHFQPPRASFFIAKLTEKYFFRRYAFDTALKASLSEEVGLGAHGNVKIISRDNRGQWTERTFIWSHIASRPWGNEVSQQCPGCKRLRPWAKPQVIKESEECSAVESRGVVRHTVESRGVVRHTAKRRVKHTLKHSVKHACRFCPYTRQFDKPANLIQDGVMAECGRGDWHFTRSIIPSNVS